MAMSAAERQRNYRARKKEKQRLDNASVTGTAAADLPSHPEIVRTWLKRIHAQEHDVDVLNGLRCIEYLDRAEARTAATVKQAMDVEEAQWLQPAAEPDPEMDAFVRELRKREE